MPWKVREARTRPRSDFRRIRSNLWSEHRVNQAFRRFLPAPRGPSAGQSIEHKKAPGYPGAFLVSVVDALTSSER